MTKSELLTQAIANMTPEQKAEIFPPIERKNFVVRKSWLGRNQVITFTNNKGQTITYNHDEALKVMLPESRTGYCPLPDPRSGVLPAEPELACTGLA